MLCHKHPDVPFSLSMRRLPAHQERAVFCENGPSAVLNDAAVGRPWPVSEKHLPLEYQAGQFAIEGLKFC